MGIDDLVDLDCEELLVRLNSIGNLREKNSIIVAIGNYKCDAAYETLRNHVRTNLRHQALIAMGKINYNKTIGVFVDILRVENKGKAVNRAIETLSYVLANRIELTGIDKFIEELGIILPKYLDSGNYLDGKVKRIMSRALRDSAKILKVESVYLAMARDTLYS
ncbi:hypothetical protein J4230_02450 [Candidatus Woesearchaeota archaeon]|nr:hypothetical protein [Candidatus Woesearchaeota archaeon]